MLSDSPGIATVSSSVSQLNPNVTLSPNSNIGAGIMGSCIVSSNLPTPTNGAIIVYTSQASVTTSIARSLPKASLSAFSAPGADLPPVKAPPPYQHSVFHNVGSTANDSASGPTSWYQESRSMPKSFPPVAASDSVTASSHQDAGNAVSGATGSGSGSSKNAVRKRTPTPSKSSLVVVKTSTLKQDSKGTSPQISVMRKLVRKSSTDRSGNFKAAEIRATEV